MAKLKGLTLTKKKVSQKFNLKELLGQTPTTKQKKLFGELVVEEMNLRTLGGDDIRGNDFTPYSPKYAKAKGVSTDSVDMFLDGDMLDSINSRSRGDDVTVSVGKGETGKAYGHMTGMKGHPTIKKGKKREFFGMRQSDLKPIIKQVKALEKLTPKQKEKVIEEVESFEPSPSSGVTLAELRALVESIEVDLE